MMVDKSEDILQFFVGDSPYKLEAKLLFCGEDLIVVVGGGSKDHVGAVAVAHSHSSLKDAEKPDSTASCITLQGHKEGLIAHQAALELSKLVRKTVVLSVGIHIDSASKAEIDLLVNNYWLLMEKVEMYLTTALDKDN